MPMWMLPFRQKTKQNNSKSVREGVRSDAQRRELSDSLGPLTETFSAPLPAPLVKTLKSATSFTLTPLGWRPLPVALQAFGFMAERNNNECEKQKYLVKQKATESSQHLTAMLVAKTFKYPIQVGFLKGWLTEPVNEKDAFCSTYNTKCRMLNRILTHLRASREHLTTFQSVTPKCWLQA